MVTLLRLVVTPAAAVSTLAAQDEFALSPKVPAAALPTPHFTTPRSDSDPWRRIKPLVRGAYSIPEQFEIFRLLNNQTISLDAFLGAHHILVKGGYSFSDQIQLLQLLTRQHVALKYFLHAHELMSWTGRAYNYLDAVGGLSQGADITEINVTRGNQDFLQPVDVDTVAYQELYRAVIYNPEAREVFESPLMRVVDATKPIATPRLGQCRGTFIFNLDRPTHAAVHHSSTGMNQEVFAAVAKIGRGEKVAVIIGGWSGRHEAQMLNRYLNMPVALIQLDATTHINVAYLPGTRALVFAYGDGEKYYRGDLPIDSIKA